MMILKVLLLSLEVLGIGLIAFSGIGLVGKVMPWLWLEGELPRVPLHLRIQFLAHCLVVIKNFFYFLVVPFDFMDVHIAASAFAF